MFKIPATHKREMLFDGPIDAALEYEMVPLVHPGSFSRDAKLLFSIEELVGCFAQQLIECSSWDRIQDFLDESMHATHRCIVEQLVLDGNNKYQSAPHEIFSTTKPHLYDLCSTVAHTALSQFNLTRYQYTLGHEQNMLDSWAEDPDDMFVDLDALSRNVVNFIIYRSQLLF